MVAQTAPSGGVSLRPSDATQGGLIDNVNLLIQKAEFGWWNYNGAIPTSVPAAHIHFRADDGTEYDQWYACGDAKAFSPSADASELIPTGGATGLNENSNFMIFLKSLVAAGFPEARFDSKIAFLNGLYGFFRRVPAPERAGLAPTPRADGTNRQNTILICGRIENLPWEPSKAPTVQAASTNGAMAVPSNGAAPVMATAVAPAPAPAPVAMAAPAPVAAPEAPAVNPVIAAAAETWLTNFLASTPIVGKQDLSTAAFTAHTADPNRNDIVTLLFNDQYLAGLAAAGKIGFDGVNVSKVG